MKGWNARAGLTHHTGHTRLATTTTTTTITITITTITTITTTITTRLAGGTLKCFSMVKRFRPLENLEAENCKARPFTMWLFWYFLLNLGTSK